MAEAAVQRIGNPSEGRRSHRATGLAVASGVLALDQAVKWIMLHPLHLVDRSVGGEGVPVLPVFRFLYTGNPGISMRFLPATTPAGRWLLVALTAGICAFVLAWMWREKRRDDMIGLALILGGALGNIADRVRLGFVVDYADLHFGDFHPFQVFNLGDAAIAVGVLLLLAGALLRGERARRGPAVETRNG
jgi:signal peptidase II